MGNCEGMECEGNLLFLGYSGGGRLHTNLNMQFRGLLIIYSNILLWISEPTASN